MTLDEVAALEALHATGSKARLNAMVRDALPDLLALARRALEADARPDADDVPGFAAAECRALAETPPPSTDTMERLLWGVACHACAARVEEMEVHVVSRLVLTDGESAP